MPGEKEPNTRPKTTLAGKLGGCGQGCTLTAAPALLASSMDWTHLTVRGVDFGGDGDWVGLFLKSDMPAAGVCAVPRPRDASASAAWHTATLIRR